MAQLYFPLKNMLVVFISKIKFMENTDQLYECLKIYGVIAMSNTQVVAISKNHPENIAKLYFLLKTGPI